MKIHIIVILLFISCVLHAQERKGTPNDSTPFIRDLIAKGISARDIGNLKLCFTNFTEALDISKRMNNLEAISIIYLESAKVCFDWFQIASSIQFAEKSLNYALQTKNEDQIATSYSILGIYTCEGGNYTEGIEILEKNAIPLLKKSNNEHQLCKVYHRLIMTFMKLNKQSSLSYYMKQFDKLTHVLKTEEDWYHYYRAKSMMLKSNKQYSDALFYLHKVIGNIENGYQNSINHQAYRMAAECYMELSDYKLGYDMLNKAFQLRDSAYSRRQLLQLTYYLEEHHIKENQLEIIHLKQNQLQQESTMLRHRTWAFSITFALLVVIALLLLRRQREKTRSMEIAREAEEKGLQFLLHQKDTDRRLTRRYIEGLESERNRLASELHDDVCNRLMSLEMKIRSLTNEMSLEAVEQIEVLADIRNRVRNVSHELMPPVFQFATLDETLSDHIGHLELPADMSVTYTSTEGVDWNIVCEEVGFEFYRIIQEALNNCIKHSNANNLWVSLKLTQNQLSASVKDNGKGFDPERKMKGIGLRNIYQRIESINGTIQLHSEVGSGTSLEINVTIA